MVIGGLTANMLFTRAVIPAGYEVVEKLLGRSADGAAAQPAQPTPLAAPMPAMDGAPVPAAPPVAAPPEGVKP
jgi:hypothetical protein